MSWVLNGCRFTSAQYQFKASTPNLFPEQEQEIIQQQTEIIKKRIQREIARIKSSFTSSPLTLKKIKVLKNFQKYFEKNAVNFLESPDLSIKHWAQLYIDKHAKNPFQILNQQRRTIFSMFNPKVTKSVSFFDRLVSRKDSSSFVRWDHRLEDIKMAFGF